MAKAKLTGFDELERMLGGLAQPGKMAVKAVDAAAPILERSLKSEIAKTTGKDHKRGKSYRPGSLEASIKRTKAKENQLGVFSVVKPDGKDSKGVRNVEKLAYLEYGVASRGQLPHPVRQKAINAAEDECVKAMEEVVCREVGKLQ